MSLLSRLIAPADRADLAGALTALLAPPPGDSSGGLPDRPPAAVTRPPFPLQPVGLGTAAARLPAQPGRAAPAEPRPEAGRVGAPSGLGMSAFRARSGSPAATRIPSLYCPGPVRDNRALGKEVNDRLIQWAEVVGIYPGQLDSVRSAGVGRLIMLTHPDCDDPDRLLSAAKCALAEWATDDHYVDDETLGADPGQLAARLVLANAVVDPAHLPTRYTPYLERAVRDDPVLIAYRSSLSDLARYASASQMRRLRHELAVMFVAYNQEGAWRTEGRTPAAWEYVVHRYENSFLPCMVLIDAMGSYEVPYAEFADPAVRRVFTLAGLATVLVNDLYSVAKEQSGPDFNLPKLIAAEERCGLQAGIDRTAEIHDELVHTVEEESAALSLHGSPTLQRLVAGIWAWMGGNHEWHRTSPRYNTGQGSASPRGGAST
ncbi:MAG: family 2 encapsulin nanocompartment cargo protein terpene cyclase [Actinomycetota bacterium]